ncbi:MAG: SDR family oxidoreductase [Elusimicrobia bacterium]|nr:SDR family oxidoreductase [Elusimicrobiota bacterium]
MHISDSVVLITGAARRVGRVIALTLASKGAKIAIHYNFSGSEAKALARELSGKYGTQAVPFQADLNRTAQIQRLASQVLKKFGSVDVLVNSASIYNKTPFGTITEKEWESHLDINLKAPFFLSQAIGKAMQKKGRGKIINLCDWSGLRPYSGYIPYCISKGGLITLTYALAKALAPQVQVNAILPGPVLLPEQFNSSQRRAIQEATLLKKLGSPKDIANAVAFFIEGSDFITGATLPVDGGRLIA